MHGHEAHCVFVLRLSVYSWFDKLKATGTVKRRRDCYFLVSVLVPFKYIFISGLPLKFS